MFNDSMLTSSLDMPLMSISTLHEFLTVFAPSHKRIMCFASVLVALKASDVLSFYKYYQTRQKKISGR